MNQTFYNKGYQINKVWQADLRDYTYCVSKEGKGQHLSYNLQMAKGWIDLQVEHSPNHIRTR